LSGEPLDQAAREARALGASAVLVNCAPPEDIRAAVPRIGERSDGPVGAFAHVGKFDPPSWKFEFFPQFVETDAWTPERFARVASEWRERGANIVGGCCGTTPQHTRALAAAIGDAR
jgi:S-methylmethionine-dependent homocysteine/selenocysteine methylase